MIRIAAQILETARARIKEVSVEDVQDLKTRKDLLILDVREGEEHREGIIPGARCLPRGFLELRIESLVPHRDRPLLLYCAGGARSALAAQTLGEMGYEEVLSLRGGFKAWREAGQPVQLP
ncbi:MAG: rhodanese-like domain-containing protein [Acidobacteriota bacterium]